MSPPDRDHAAGRRVLVYVGPSMRPTFRDLDLLALSEDPAVRVGDVIAYRAHGGRILVHRVIGFDGDGYVTRGDGGGTADPDPVPPPSVLGRAVACTRHGRERAVLGGRAGLALANARHALWPVLRAPRAAYARAIATGMVRHWTAPLFRLELVPVPRRDGTVYLVRHRARVIGAGRPGGGWRLRFPYALLVDPDRVPCPRD